MKTALTLMAPRHPGDRLMYLNGALAALDHVRNTVAPGRATIDYNDRRRELLDARQELLDSIRGGAAGPGKTDMVKGGS